MLPPPHAQVNFFIDIFWQGGYAGSLEVGMGTMEVGGEQRTQVSFQLPSELWDDVRMLAARTRQQNRRVVIALLRAGLEVQRRAEEERGEDG